MTVDSIKAEIAKLPDSERRQLADWLEGLEEQAWDEEIERDFSTGGAGLALLDQVRQDIADGKERR